MENDQVTFVKGLQCRECHHQFPKEPLHVCEFCFGIAVILGLLTRLGALWFIIDMLGAIAIVHIKNGWSGPGGLEFPVLLLAASIVVFLGGPGLYAIDDALSKK